MLEIPLGAWRLLLRWRWRGWGWGITVVAMRAFASTVDCHCQTRIPASQHQPICVYLHNTIKQGHTRVTFSISRITHTCKTQTAACLFYTATFGSLVPFYLLV